MVSSTYKWRSMKRHFHVIRRIHGSGDKTKNTGTTRIGRVWGLFLGPNLSVFLISIVSYSVTNYSFAETKEVGIIKVLGTRKQHRYHQGGSANFYRCNCKLQIVMQVDSPATHIKTRLLVHFPRNSSKFRRKSKLEVR